MLYCRLRIQKVILSIIFITGIVGIHFFPLAASAQCCVCQLNDPQAAESNALLGQNVKTDDKVKNICFSGLQPGECGQTLIYESYTGAKQNIVSAGSVKGEITVKGVKTQNGLYYACNYQDPGQCACPDVKQSVQAFVPSGGGELKVYIEPKPREAIKFKPQISIPGTDFVAGRSIDLSSKTIGEYIAGLYYFIIASIGLLAVIGIMIGGFQYLMAGGSPEKITSAKSTIMGAITGLIIALTSYLLFYTINPRLVEFDTALSTLEDVKSQATNVNMNFGPQACTKTESSPNFLSIADPTVFPKAPIRVDNSQVEQPPRLMSQVIAKLNNKKLEDWLKGENSWKSSNVKFTLVINSAYRSMANQAGLRGCYDYSVPTPPSCPYSCTGCNKAAVPSCDAPHQAGYAVDVCLEISSGILPSGVINDAACNMLTRAYTPPSGTPPTGPVVKEFQAKMNEVGLDRFCEEWWHFESGQDLGTHQSSHCPPGVYTVGGQNSGDNEVITP
ncbi:MAG: hypothetical protein WC659_04495 [Patescibacteria group bacterium]